MAERQAMLPAPARASAPWWRKAITTIADWLVIGPDPKIRDSWNSSRRAVETAGVTVNDVSAMRLSTFWACSRLIASTIGALPLPVYRRGRGGEARPARDSGLWRVLHESPNADQTPVDYWEGAALALVLRGNHFARKIKDGNRLIGLEPVRPDIVAVRRREDGRIGYAWSADGKHFDLTEDDVFHVRGFGGGPLSGLSTISYAAESLGIAIAAERAAGSMFANGMKPSGVLQTEMALTKEQRDETEALLLEKYQGALNAGSPLVLSHNMKWQAVTINADDAQLLESRGHSVEEICRWFGVPPFMIGHTEKSTSWGSGIEQQLLVFQKFTLQPYLERIEQSISKQLITPAERAAGLFAEFNVEGLLRADSAARATFYQAALGDTQKPGWMVRNEVRRKENLPPIPGWDEPIQLITPKAAVEQK